VIQKGTKLRKSWTLFAAKTALQRNAHEQAIIRKQLLAVT